METDGPKYPDPATIGAVRALTDRELRQAIQHSSHSVSGSDLLTEATRREAARQTEAIGRLTWAVVVFNLLLVIGTTLLVIADSAILKRIFGL
ncbi:MAG TPA: hypothetical protein VES36_11580 [Candidatus Limnocylindrales bacterium]|nr:hypothetical protein [Candidatus Limnocylindrales bacterium]